MKIAVMMRSMDQRSGFQAYTESLVESLLNIDGSHSYLLLYRNNEFYGRFSDYPNVKEVLIKARNKLVWDQVAVPYVSWKEGANVIFNPKFSVPLISHCPVAMGLQEPAWWTMPQDYEWLDRNYMRAMLPLYLRKAAHIFPMSRFILEENRRVLNHPLENATLAYSAPQADFAPCEDQSFLDEYRKKLNLPERYILSVTRVTHPGVEGSTSFYPGKNPETTFRAYAKIRDLVPHKLVFVGHRVREYLLNVEGEDVDLEGVEFQDFIPHKDVHILYKLADLYVNPAPYEGCPNTVLEAMASGCPMVLANAGGSADVGQGAALLAEPYQVDHFAHKMLQVLTDDSLRQDLGIRSLKRARDFNWDHTARQVLKGLVQVVEKDSRMGR